MIRVFAADVTQLDFDEGLLLVSPARRRKAGSYLKERDRKLSLGAELLLNYGLSLVAPALPRPAEYFVDANGKPRLTASGLHFNLSHSGAYAACAICDRPVGVDVELEAEMDLDIARKFFHPDEYRAIAASDDPARCFFRYWVLKESYLKAVGFGLGRALDSFRIDMSEGPARVIENGRVPPFMFQYSRVDGHHMAVCCGAHAPLDGDVFEVVDIHKCLCGGMRRKADAPHHPF